MMKKGFFTNLKFQQRLMLGIAVLLLLTTTVLGLVGNHMAQNFIRTRFKDRMEFLAKYLAANTELGILIGDKKMLHRLASNLLKEKDVIQVKIFDNLGRLLAMAGDPNADDKWNKIVADVKLSTDSETLAFGLKTTAGKKIGWVEISYITSSIDQLSNNLKTRYIILTLLIALAAVTFFMFFTKSITAPLENLMEVVKEVTSGNLDVELEESGPPETRQLAKAFNTMIQTLRSNRFELEQTYQQLIQERSLAEVGKFSVTVAHEVKNPLGIIKGALDVLKKDEIDSETRSTMITYIEDEIKRLNDLIQDFLDFSRPKPLNFKNVDLGELLEELSHRLSLEWEAKGVTIVFKKPSHKGQPIRADKEALARAFINIIQNACEVSESGQEIVIQLTDEKKKVKVIICDSGPGIPAEKKMEIFKPFFTEKSKGTGLGLTLAQKIINAHRGEIEVKDNDPRGTCMVITLFRKEV